MVELARMSILEQSIRKHLRYNVIVNLLDGAFFGAGWGFGSFGTIIPLFVSRMTDSALLIGLISCYKGYSVRGGAVGVGTALFYDPLICPAINAGITDYLRWHEHGNVSELVGALVW